MKIELLAPAGNMDTLIAAINNGADAVYIGGKSFGARAFAPNFDNAEMEKAINYAHLYGVKIYVTANTVVFENEIEDFLNYMKFLYENNVDAVIMQDLGMISLTHKLIPQLEIHASTQINIHSDEGLKLLKNIGVKRAVLAREMSLKEISDLKTDIEKEIFIHGALCVSYSGQCLFSSLNGGRSGNRGMCTGCCRMNYDLIKNGKILNLEGKYPLSTKELCSTDHIKEIIESGVNSLKIEGRMKSPEYVGYVTKVYRRLIDEYYSKGLATVKKEEMINLAKLFNREFTNGYLFNDNIYNIKSPNHIGYPLGEVIKVTPYKIYIKFSDCLYQGDGIRFTNSQKGMIANMIYNEKGLLVNHINQGNIGILDNKIGLISKDCVNKTIDSHLIKEINVLRKKIPISFNLEAKLNKPLKLEVSDGKNKVLKTGAILEKALKRQTTKDEIIEKLDKLGNTPFCMKNVSIILDDVFIPMTFLNNLRQEACTELAELRVGSKKEINFKYEKKLGQPDADCKSVLVRNENQLKSVLNKCFRIYTEDFNLYKKYKDKNIYYKLPRIISNFPNYQNEKLLVSELGSIEKYALSNEIITDYPLNITNSESVNFLHSLNVKIVTLSPEISDIDEVLKYTSGVENIVYGKMDLMILKDFYIKDSNLFLKDRLGHLFSIINGDYTTILHYKNIEKKSIKGDIRFNLFDEKEKEINDILNI
jgi:putative protease